VYLCVSSGTGACAPPFRIAHAPPNAKDQTCACILPDTVKMLRVARPAVNRVFVTRVSGRVPGLCRHCAGTVPGLTCGIAE